MYGIRTIEMRKIPIFRQTSPLVLFVLFLFLKCNPCHPLFDLKLLNASQDIPKEFLIDKTR